MALSREQKETKRRTVGRAVKMLRNRLGWSQPKLARAIGDDLDSGSVSRWERGLLAPQPANREALARMAERHGWNDLVAAFSEPLSEWKAVIFDPSERHLLALFEIILLNRDLAEGDGSAISQTQFQEVKNAVLDAVKSLTRAHAAGEQIDMIGDEQVAAWLYEIGGTTKRKGRTVVNGKGKREDDGKKAESTR